MFHGACSAEEGSRPALRTARASVQARARARLALLGFALALAVAGGCGSTAPRGAGPVIEHAGTLELVRKSGAHGPDLAVLQRPLGELVWVALWIDAGSRDAEPAQVATLAAWHAAAQGGRRVRAHVEPEGTELAMPCPRRELPRCLGELARALSVRSVSDGALRAGLSRLVETRRAADAHDEGRAADRLALAALWGRDSEALLPLGDASADRDVERARVESFLAAHYGPRRALLIVVGELDERAVISQVEGAWSRNAPAAQRRVEVRSGPESSGVAAEIGASNALSVALAAASPEAAYAVTEALIARVEQEGVARRVQLQVVRLRGHAVGLARLQAVDVERATRLVAQELVHARQGAVPETPRVPGESTPLSLARQLGARWAAQSGAGGEPLLELGVGAVVKGDRGDRLGLADPDEALRERARQRLEHAFEDGLATSQPEMPAASAQGATSVTFGGGPRVELREVRGDQLALAVRFARAGLPEPPGQHGQAALLALLTTTACAGLEAPALEARLAELGARLEPLVDADGFGLVLTASLARWAEALDLGLSCALRPSLERRHLGTARLRLFERLGGEGGPGELRAAVAELLSPASPAAIAPWGNPARQASVSLPDLRALHDESARAPALRVAVVAPIARDAMLAAVGRRLAGFGSTPGTSPSTAPRKVAAPPTPPARTLLSHAGRAELPQPTLGLAVWRAPGSDLAGAEAFAALAHATLARKPGLVVTWHDAGRNEGEAWAAVAMTGPPEALIAAQATVAALGATLPAPSLDAAADAACAAVTERTARQAATPAAQAIELVAERPPPKVVPADPVAARALAHALARSRPTFLPLR